MWNQTYQHFVNIMTKLLKTRLFVVIVLVILAVDKGDGKRSVVYAHHRGFNGKRGLHQYPPWQHGGYYGKRNLEYHAFPIGKRKRGKFFTPC